MRVRALLIAAAVLVVALGAGAVLLAGNDDDHPSTTPFSSSDEPSGGGTTATPPEASTPEETTPAPATPPEATAPDQQAAPTTSDAAPEPSAPAPKPKRKTHFKREPKAAERNDAPDRLFVVPPAREFSGDGNASLGTVDVKTTAVLKWRTHGRLEVQFGREAFPIIAPTSNGQLVLPPFRFEEVRVIAAGPWRMTISPR